MIAATLNEVEGTDADAVSAPREDTANELEAVKQHRREHGLRWV